MFAERFGDNVLPTWSRRTARLESIVHHLGLALGGRPAASFAKRLMLPVSNDTLLRVVRRRTASRGDPLTVAGVDDWAFRRNRRYGTIVCDLTHNATPKANRRFKHENWGRSCENGGRYDRSLSHRLKSVQYARWGLAESKL